jgi:hypothetical protein
MSTSEKPDPEKIKEAQKALDAGFSIAMDKPREFKFSPGLFPNRRERRARQSKRN